MEIQCARIREKLVQAREQYKRSRDKDRVFGATSHEFLMESPLAEETVAAFEAEYGVALPAEYRAFLTSVGSRGAGPSYGIMPLDKWDEGLVIGLSDEEMQNAVLAKPCRLREGMDCDEDERWLSEASGNDANWEEKFNNDQWTPYEGCLTLCHNGCALYCLLVVTGGLRGRIINANWVYGFGISPHPHFLDWYEAWLDRALSGEKAEWF